MIEINEERLEEISNEYELDINIVRDYAKVLLTCPLIADDETFDRMLENAVSMVNPIEIGIDGKLLFERSKSEILIKTLQLTFNEYDDIEIQNIVEKMLEPSEEKRR